MTPTSGSDPRGSPVGAAPPPVRPPDAAIRACCSMVYRSPLVELLVGESLHPGGLRSTRELLEASELHPGERLLDAGCGVGASSRVAAVEFGLFVDGVDASAGALVRARERESAGRVRWTEADLAALPFGEAAFDGVLAECVLSTVGRREVLIELRRVLRRGGRLVMSDVEVGAGPIPALADHRLLGAALCVTDTWRSGELESVLPETGFVLERRWDRTASILELIDRIEARIGLAAVAVRDLGLDLATLAGGTDPLGPELATPQEARRLADEVRAAVRRGDLRYFAALARAS